MKYGRVFVLLAFVACTGTSDDPSGETTTLPPSASSQPPVTAEVIDELGDSDIHWQVLDVEVVGPVVHVDGRILMLHGGIVSEGAGTVWASTDGVEWEVLSYLIPAGGSAGRVSPMRVNRLGSSLAVWGWVELAGTDEQVGVVWVSLDGGETWVMSVLPGVVDVVTTPDGFIAIGDEHNRSSVFSNERRGWVRASVDGVNWDLLFVSDDPDGHASTMSRAVWHGHPLALGFQAALFLPDEDNPVMPDEWPHPSVAWLNESGIAVASNHPGILWQLVSTSWGIVGVAPYESTQGAFWLSPTGADWTQVDLGAGWRASVADYVDGTLYVSAWKHSEGPEFGIEEAGVWRSQDGESWQLLPVPDEVSMGMHVSVSGSTVVLTGWTGLTSRLAIGTLKPQGDR